MTLHRRTLRTLRSAALVPLLATALPGAATTNEAPVRIMPLGDSLTSGMSNAPVKGAYRNQLHTLLSQAGYHVDFIGTFTDVDNPPLPDGDHQGLGSARIDQLSSNLPAWLEATEDPDVVLLLIGTNDFWQNYDTAGAEGRLESLIVEIAFRQPTARILLSTLPPRRDNAALEAAQVAFNKSMPGIVARQSALGRQVGLVDMHAALGAADLNIDGVHLNATGYNRMAELWYRAIASAVSPSGSTNPPVILRCTPGADAKSVAITFSKPLDDSAANPANYRLASGAGVLSASLDMPTKRTVTLATNALPSGIIDTVSITGVRDRTAARLPIAPGTMAAFSIDAATNGGFEQQLKGWTAAGNVETKSGTPYTSTEGANMAAFNSNESTPNGTLTQSFATTPGQSYELSFDAGAFGYNTNEQKLSVTVTGSGGLVSDIVAIRAPGSGGTRWIPRSYTFTANSTTSTLVLRDVSTTSGSIDLMLDRVRVGAREARTLAVASSPDAGANVLVSATDLLGNQDGATGLLRHYSDKSVVTLTAPRTHAGNSFLRWQRHGVDLTGSLPSLTVTMDNSLSLTAVYGSNSPPQAVADAYSVAAGSTLNVPATGVLTNDSDADGNALSAVVNAPPLRGTLDLQTDGSFTYTPASGFSGTDSFTYHAFDGVNSSTPVTVSLTVYQAESMLAVNGSFESDLTGWTRSGNMAVQSAAPYTPTKGTKLVAFNAGQLAPNGVLSQTLPTTGGRGYRLSFDMGAFGYNTNTQKLQVTIAGKTALLAQTLSVAAPGNGTTRWLPQSFQFVADGPSTTVTFRDVSTTGSSIDLVLDNVAVAGAIPDHTLTVESTPSSGIVIAASPPDRNGLAGGTSTFTASYPQGTIVNLSAPVTTLGSAFVKWQRNGVDIGTQRHISMSIDAATTVTAVYGVNARPVATADSYSTLINTPLAIPPAGVLANDTDADLNPLTATLRTPPSHGTLVLNPNGALTYTPAEGYSGKDSFTYQASDGPALSDPVEVTLEVAAISPGTLVNGSFENGEAGWTMSGNRLLIDSAPPYQASNGTKLLVLNGAQTAPNAVVSQDFTTVPGQAYQLELDAGIVGASGTQQRLQVTLQGGTTLLSQTETLSGGGTTAARWSTKTYRFIADSASTRLTLTDVSTSTKSVDLLVDHVRLATGTARILTVDSSAGNGVPVTVSPTDMNAQQSGTTRLTRFYNPGTEVTLAAPVSHSGARFMKWTRDGADAGNNPSLSLTIGTDHTTLNAVYTQNSAPFAASDNHSLEMDSVLTIPAPGVLANDQDPDADPLTAKLVTPPSNGNVRLDADGGFVYAPSPGFTGTDSFTYRSHDGNLDSAPATVQLQVLPFAAGTLVNGSFEEGETGWTITGNRIVADSAAPYVARDGRKLMVANGGNVTPNAVMSQTIATTPGKTYVLSLDMGVIASGSGAIGAQQRLRVIATGASERLNQLEAVTSTSATVATWVTKSFTFTADSTSTTIQLADQSTSGTSRDLLVDNIRCAIRNLRTLRITATPESGVAMTITPPDLAQTGNGTTALTRTYENDTAVTVSAPATAGSAAFLKWTRNGLDLTRETSVTLTMNADAVLHAVYGVNRPPVASPDELAVDQDGTLELPTPGVLANDADPDGDPLAVVPVSGPANGTLDLRADGGLTYRPTAGFSGSDTFSYRASDGNLQSDAVTSRITVRPSVGTAIANGSFENGESGWTITGNRVLVESATPYLAPDERRLMVLNGGQVSPNAILTQTVATTPGKSYTLAFDLGAVGTAGLAQRLEVTVRGNATLVSKTESVTAAGNAAGVWDMRWYTFVADAAATTLTLRDVSTTGTSVDLLLDDVRILPSGARTITVSAASRGLAVSSTPADLRGAGDGITPFRRCVADGATATFTAPASLDGGAFLKWTRNGSDLATTPVVTLKATEDIDLRAVYAAPPQLLANGSFEDGYSGWTRTGNQEIKNTPPYTATNGTNLVAFNTSQLAPDGTLSQSFPTVAGRNYQLTFDLGLLSYNTYSQNLLVEVEGATRLLSQNLAIRGVSGSNLRWLPQSFVFTADSASTTLRFRDTSSSTAGIDLLLDRVSVTGSSVRRTVTIASTPSDGTAVSLSPSDASGLGAGSTPFNRGFEHGTSVTLTAPASSAGLPFSKWRKGTTDLASTPTVTIRLDGDTTLTAVYAANSAPSAAADAYVATLGTALTVSAPGVLGNDSDADAQSLTAVLESPPANGTLQLAANGSFTYQPAAGFTGTDSFRYRATDGTARSDAATVTIETRAIAPGSLVNGSFEENESGWTMSGNRLITPSAAPYTTATGSSLLVFNGGQTNPDGAISQSFATVPGQTYAVEFDMGILGGSGTKQSLEISMKGASTLLSRTESINGPGVQAPRWLPKSFSFTADSTNAVLTLRDVSTTTTSVDLLIDNVRIVTGTTRTLVFNTTLATAVPFTLSPADLAGGSGGNTEFTRSYKVGSTLTVSAPTLSGSAQFSAWERNGSTFSTSPEATFTVDGNEIITAVYATGTSGGNRTLTVQSEPTQSVQVGVSPADAANLAGGSTRFSRNYPSGTVVTLSAPATAGGANFTMWRRNGVDYSDSPVTTVTMDSAYTLTAVYATGFVNGSFESGLAGWTTGGSTDTVKLKTDLPASDGTNLIEFNGGSSPLDGTIRQSFSTTPGATYAVTFDMGVLSFNTNTQRIEVAATGTGSLLTQTFSLAGIGNGRINWSTKTANFTANSNTTTLTFSDRSTTGNALDMLLDNVRVNRTDLPAAMTLTVQSSPVTGVAVACSPADRSNLGGGSTQFTRSYDSGTTVTLTAPATSGGASFVKWLKNGADLSTNTSASVTMDASQTLTAVYSAPPTTVTSFANGSFESGFTAWTWTGGPETVKVNAEIPATNGTRLIEFNSNNSGLDGAIAQTFTTVPGTSYSVTFDMGVLAYNTLAQTIEASATGTGILASRSYTLNGIGGGKTKWATQTFTFTANTTSTTLRFRDRSTTGTGLDLLLDHVRVSASTGGGGTSGPSLVTNGSFEQDYTGWTPAGSTRIEMPGSAFSTSGIKILSFNVSNLPVGGTVTQTLATTPGQSYEIAYDVGVLGYVAKTQRLNVTLTGNTTLLNQTTSVNGRADFVMVWVPQSFRFTADSSRTVLTFKDVSADGTALDLFLDSVRVNAVSSPTTQTLATTATSTALPQDDTLPTAGADLLRTPRITLQAGRATINWHADIAGTYALERSADLTTWETHTTLEATVPGPLGFTDEAPLPDHGFYRVRRIDPTPPAR